jgi:DNA-binding beta-propeller fold protein YncE
VPDRILPGMQLLDGTSTPPPGRATAHRRLSPAGGALAALVAITAAAGAATMVLPSGHDAHPGDHQSARAAAALRPVERPQTARINGGRGGTVRLSVAAEVAGAARGPLQEAPAGVPLRMTFTLPRAAGAGDVPRLTARRLDGAVPGASLGALSRSETFVLDRDSGQIAVPNAAAGPTTGAGQHEHGAQGAASPPGQGLASTMPGGGFAAATQISRGATAVTPDPAGRFLAAAYRDRRAVEIVDLLQRERTGAVALPGRPDGLAFAPDGRLWVTDASSSLVTIVDPVARRPVGSVGTAIGAKAIAFGGGHVLVVGSGAATLIDERTGHAQAPAPLGARAIEPAYARRSHAFVVAARDGVLIVPVEEGRLGTPRRIPLGARTDVQAVAVGPDGRTAVAADAAGNRLLVIDTARARVLRAVQAGSRPSEIVVLDHFAIARNAGSANLTWVDLAEPSRSNDLPLDRHPATGLTLAPGGRGVLAASPRDRHVFTLHTMMGRPMIMGVVPDQLGAEVAVQSGVGVARTGPRTVVQRTVLAQPGRHRLELRLADGGTATFTIRVARGVPGAPAARPQRRLLTAKVGDVVPVRFRVTGAAPKDAQVLAYATGIATTQTRVPAHPRGDGVYEALLRARTVGDYRVQLLSEQAELGNRPEDSATLRVRP